MSKSEAAQNKKATRPFPFLRNGALLYATSVVVVPLALTKDPQRSKWQDESILRCIDSIVTRRYRFALLLEKTPIYA